MMSTVLSVWTLDAASQVPWSSTLLETTLVVPGGHSAQETLLVPGKDREPAAGPWGHAHFVLDEQGADVHGQEVCRLVEVRAGAVDCKVLLLCKIHPEDSLVPG